MPTFLSALFAGFILRVMTGDHLPADQLRRLDSPEVDAYMVAIDTMRTLFGGKRGVVVVVLDTPDQPPEECDLAIPRDPGWTPPKSCRARRPDIIPPATAAAQRLGLRTISQDDLALCHEAGAPCRLPADSATSIIIVGRGTSEPFTDAAARVNIIAGDANNSVDLSRVDNRWVVRRVNGRG